MKWLTHQVAAVGAAWILDLPPAALAGTFVGSTIPDVLDQRLAGLFPDRQKAFNRIHRGATHWFGWWAALLFLGLMPPAFLHDIPFLNFFLMGLGFGGLAHVALDMLTVYGIPLVPWSRKLKISFGLCRTGGPGEYLFLAVLLLLFGVIERDNLLAVTETVRRLARF